MIKAGVDNKRQNNPLFNHFFNCHLAYNMGLDAKKPVYGVSDKMSFKPVSSATETS